MTWGILGVLIALVIVLTIISAYADRNDDV